MKHLLIILCCVVLLLMGIGGFLFFQLNQDHASGQFNGLNVQFNTDHPVMIETVKGWEFLEIPNPYLNYPEAPIQIASEYKEAYLLVIPETFPEEIELSLDEFYQVVIDKTNEAHDVIDTSTLTILDSSWSERGYFTYSANYEETTLKWYVQLDVAGQHAYRTIGWCAEDKFEQFADGFQAIANSLQPVTD